MGILWRLLALKSLKKARWAGRQAGHPGPDRELGGERASGEAGAPSRRSARPNRCR
jgi:hypothetical protein